MAMRNGAKTGRNKSHKSAENGYIRGARKVANFLETISRGIRFSIDFLEAEGLNFHRICVSPNLNQHKGAQNGGGGFGDRKHVQIELVV